MDSSPSLTCPRNEIVSKYMTLTNREANEAYGNRNHVKLWLVKSNQPICGISCFFVWKYFCQGNLYRVFCIFLNNYVLLWKGKLFMLYTQCWRCSFNVKKYLRKWMFHGTWYYFINVCILLPKWRKRLISVYLSVSSYLSYLRTFFKFCILNKKCYTWVTGCT